MTRVLALAIAAAALVLLLRPRREPVAWYATVDDQYSELVPMTAWVGSPN